MRTIEQLGAVSIFAVHCVIGIFIFFGWLWPQYWAVYALLLVYLLVQNVVLGYCVLSRWEFSLRRMLNPRIRYEYNFTTFYTYKLTNRRLSTRFVQIAGSCFLVAMLAITTVSHFA